MKPLDDYYDADGHFHWPADLHESVEVARALLIAECQAHSRYWTDYGQDLVVNALPAERHLRAWSERAKVDKAFRDTFAELEETKKRKIVELLEHCISGAIFSCLVTLDQFPHADLEILVRPAGSGAASPIKIAPTDIDLHDEFNKSAP